MIRSAKNRRRRTARACGREARADYLRRMRDMQGGYAAMGAAFSWRERRARPFWTDVLWRMEFAKTEP